MEKMQRKDSDLKKGWWQEPILYPWAKIPVFFMVSMVTNLIILCSIMYYFIVLSFQLVQTLMNILIYRSRSGYDFSPISSITVSQLHTVVFA